MRVAYIVFAHNIETLHGAERLVQWLYHPAHTFVFHLDYAAPVYFRCYLQQKYRESPPPSQLPFPASATPGSAPGEREKDRLG